MLKRMFGYLIVLGLVALSAVMHYVAGDASIYVDGGAVTAMAVVQATYAENIRPAVAGMIANLRDWDGITRNCETADGIGFGLAVSRGANKESGCVLGGALTIFLGVSHRDTTVDQDTPDEYAENQNVGILTKGEIWVQVTGSPDPSDPVDYDTTTGVFSANGSAGPVRGGR